MDAGIDETDAAPAPARSIAVFAPRPNPFDPHVMIPIEVRASGLVRAYVISVSGQLGATLVDRSMAPGGYTLSWDGLEASGAPVPTGTYLLRFTSGRGDLVTRKLSLVR